MADKTKYIDSKDVFANKKSIGVRIPKYLYDDLQTYSELTELNTTEIVTEVLFNFFRYKTLTNEYLLGYGNLYFDIPLSESIKSYIIDNKIELNNSRYLIENPSETEKIFIKTVKNNLDKFINGTFKADKKYEKNNIKHIGLDFAIIPDIIKNSKTNENNEIDINIINSLYCFKYEIKSINIIDVYLISLDDALNELSKENDIKTSEKLVLCLQELKDLQKEINERYSNKLHELYDTNEQHIHLEETKIKNKYISILYKLLEEIAIKYNNNNFKYGVNAFNSSLIEIQKKIESYENE